MSDMEESDKSNDINPNNQGEPMINVGMTFREIQELIWLIDDDDRFSEDAVRGVRRKLKAKQNRLRKRTGVKL